MQECANICPIHQSVSALKILKDVFRGLQRGRNTWRQCQELCSHSDDTQKCTPGTSCSGYEKTAWLYITIQSRWTNSLQPHATFKSISNPKTCISSRHNRAHKQVLITVHLSPPTWFSGWPDCLFLLISNQVFKTAAELNSLQTSLADMSTSAHSLIHGIVSKNCRKTSFVLNWQTQTLTRSVKSC